MKFTKMFAEHLTQLKTTTNGIPDFDWVIKGTENLLRYPQHRIGDRFGILTFGTGKVYGADKAGTTCIKIAVEDANRLPEGWTVRLRATHYAYVLPPTEGGEA